MASKKGMILAKLARNYYGGISSPPAYCPKGISTDDTGGWYVEVRLGEYVYLGKSYEEAEKGLLEKRLV